MPWGGGINVATPDELSALISGPAFAGKDDSDHSRLKQYKVLEKKTAAKAQSGSNEEFLLQSEIRVELIEDCRDKLTRIYEMIHRNNQLNFTKDRISQEEVDRIFTDPDIRSGVVHVSDKYGDHGIIGCYAVKDGRALQLVFSCRILGMGVEQWVYAELGYPNITVVGDVAAELNKTDKPTWINRGGSAAAEDKQELPKFIAYGACTLRPISAYLDTRLKNFKFAEIDPTPCVLNLAVTLRASDKQKKEWMSEAGPIDNEFTFDKEIYDPQTGYILITLLGTDDMYKYKSKNGGAYFFSYPLDKSNARPSIFDDYEITEITDGDISEELSYVCEHLSNGTKLLILTAPEIEFPSRSKQDRDRRLQFNKIAERLAEKYPCVHLIDIRKYAKLPTDFIDPIPEHYNRNIAFLLGNEILEYVGVKSADNKCAKLKDWDDIPDNAVIQQFGLPDSDKKCKVTTFIRNGMFSVNSEFPNSDDYTVEYTIICNRYNVYTSERLKEKKQRFNVAEAGLWKAKVVVFNAAGKVCEFVTAPINYSNYSYAKYFDPQAVNYDVAISGVDDFINRAITLNGVYTFIANQIAESASVGASIADYFLSQGIDEISVVLDSRVGSLIMPFIDNSNLKIKYLFTVDQLGLIKTERKIHNKILDFNGKLPLSPGDPVLLAFDTYRYRLIKFAMTKTRAKIFSLTGVLSCLMTKHFFVNRFKNKIPKLIAVRTANLDRRASFFDFSKLTADEKLLDDKKFINEDSAIKEIKENYDGLPRQLRRIPQEELLETMKPYACGFEKDTNIIKYNDVEGKFVNIIHGERRTVNQPQSYVGTVYIFGGPHAFGYGVKDEETIASYLQNMINLPYRVVNCANCVRYDYTSALNYMDKIQFKDNDIAVFIMANWQADFFLGVPRHWLKWEAIDDPIIKVDAFPLFEKQDRPDYFLHKLGFTPECNKELATLIRDEIYKNIKLY